MPHEELLTMSELAARLNQTYWKVRERVLAGEIPARKIGRIYLFSPNVLQQIDADQEPRTK